MSVIEGYRVFLGHFSENFPWYNGSQRGHLGNAEYSAERRDEYGFSDMEDDERRPIVHSGMLTPDPCTDIEGDDRVARCGQLTPGVQPRRGFRQSSRRVNDSFEETTGAETDRGYDSSFYRSIMSGDTAVSARRPDSQRKNKLEAEQRRYVQEVEIRRAILNMGGKIDRIETVLQMLVNGRLEQEQEPIRSRSRQSEVTVALEPGSEPIVREQVQGLDNGSAGQEIESIETRISRLEEVIKKDHEEKCVLESELSALRNEVVKLNQCLVETVEEKRCLLERIQLDQELRQQYEAKLEEMSHFIWILQAQLKECQRQLLVHKLEQEIRECQRQLGRCDDHLTQDQGAERHQEDPRDQIKAGRFRGSGQRGFETPRMRSGSEEDPETLLKRLELELVERPDSMSQDKDLRRVSREIDWSKAGRSI